MYKIVDFWNVKFEDEDKKIIECWNIKIENEDRKKVECWNVRSANGKVGNKKTIPFKQIKSNGWNHKRIHP